MFEFKTIEEDDGDYIGQFIINANGINIVKEIYPEFYNDKYFKESLSELEYFINNIKKDKKTDFNFDIDENILIKYKKDIFTIYTFNSLSSLKIDINIKDNKNELCDCLNKLLNYYKSLNNI
jgi:hypothetical protein